MLPNTDFLLCRNTSLQPFRRVSEGVSGLGDRVVGPLTHSLAHSLLIACEIVHNLLYNQAFVEFQCRVSE